MTLADDVCLVALRLSKLPQRAGANHQLPFPTVLPTYANDAIESAIPAKEVSKVALRLHHLIEACVPCEMEESQVTKAHSRVITKKVIQAAKEAGGSEYQACVV